MVKLFFGNRPIVLILLPAIIGLFGLLNYFFPHHIPENQVSLGFLGAIGSQTHWLCQGVAFSLIVINGVIINHIFNRHDFMERNSYLIALLYVVIMSFFHSFYFTSGASLAQTLLILMVVQLFKLNQNEDGRRAVFNAAFLFGLAASIHPILLAGIPFLFWMIWVVKPFSLRESALAIVGLGLPLMYAGVFGFFLEVDFVREGFSSSTRESYYYDRLALSFLVLCLILISLSPILKKIGTSTIRLKKLIRILLLFIVFSLVIALLDLFFFGHPEGLSLLVFPLMLILPYAFGIKTPRTSAVITYYLIFFIAVSKFFISFDLLGL
ncbi:MAG: DUF6427 family protein [Crocinitomicaceae bacterium]|nr:DUF6427 family protein [Crocinitomicaceae bacterium]